MRWVSFVRWCAPLEAAVARVRVRIQIETQSKRERRYEQVSVDDSRLLCHAYITSIRVMICRENLVPFGPKYLGMLVRGEPRSLDLTHLCSTLYSYPE